DGLLLTTPGRSIDPTAIARHIAELTTTYHVRGLAYDRWRIADLLREMDVIGLQAWQDTTTVTDNMVKAWTGKQWVGQTREGLRIVGWGQGWKDMAPAVDAFEAVVTDRTLKHGNHPILTWNISNAIAKTDPAGGRKLDKEKSRFRIDGAVALVMALGLRSR